MKRSMRTAIERVVPTLKPFRFFHEPRRGALQLRRATSIRQPKTMKEFELCATAAALALLAAAAALGGVVTTSDGSRIVGTVEQVADGKLVVLTEIAGRLEIDASKVTGISTL